MGSLELPHFAPTIEIIMSQPQQQHDFFSLPLKIRLSIYRHALVNKRRDGGLPRGMVQYQIMVTIRKELKDRTMTPALLRTSKQIYREALPILYSENKFLVDKAKQLLDWLQQIGSINITLLKSLRIFPHAVYSGTGQPWLGDSENSDYSGPTWCKLLNKLADEATGLEYVYVNLDAEESWGHYGAGKDLNFVRALGRMKVSRRMEIDGYFAMEWPRYLKGKLGIPVWDTQGHSQSYLRWLGEYQRGTEGLIP
ncbi:hypothetical protein V501_01004 [Pseudogymnoascus sp. VKM F-4519 (FW-2642)]|nr:hypothetical protein V501_01004 [Pseudogymnoascus sp. VKM F-4519 (FW-2642)]